MTDSSVPPNSASRKHPTANLARGIDELDALGSLAIAKRNSSSAPSPDQGKRNTSPSTATLAAAGKTSESSKSGSKSGGVEVNEGRQSSQVSRPSRVTSRPRASTRPAPEHSLWPQWLFAAAVLCAALWYLFSAEPSGKNRPLSAPHKALAPKQ